MVVVVQQPSGECTVWSVWPIHLIVKLKIRIIRVVFLPGRACACITFLSNKRWVISVFKHFFFNILLFHYSIINPYGLYKSSYRWTKSSTSSHTEPAQIIRNQEPVSKIRHQGVGTTHQLFGFTRLVWETCKHLNSRLRKVLFIHTESSPWCLSFTIFTL